MANEAQKQELKDKVTRLVDGKYGGDWERAFRHYAGKSGAGTLVERKELLELLEDAGIGNWLTRGVWADGIIDELDSSKDEKISEEELRKAMKNESALEAN
jgi:hypothetical protein